MLTHVTHRQTPYENHRQIQNWLTDRTAEELGMIYRIVNDIFEQPDADAGASFYLGAIGSLQRLKHNCCACGVDHDAEMLEQERVRMAEGLPAQDGNFEDSVVCLPNGVNIPIRIDRLTGRVQCTKCQTIFDSPEERFMQGIACPRCDWSPIS
jgi:hypothetical protein